MKVADLIGQNAFTKASIDWLIHVANQERGWKLTRALTNDFVRNVEHLYYAVGAGRLSGVDHST